MGKWESAIPKFPRNLESGEEVNNVRYGANCVCVVGLNSCWWLLAAGSQLHHCQVLLCTVKEEAGFPMEPEKCAGIYIVWAGALQRALTWNSRLWQSRNSSAQLEDRPPRSFLSRLDVSPSYGSWWLFVLPALFKLNTVFTYKRVKYNTSHYSWTVNVRTL